MGRRIKNNIIIIRRIKKSYGKINLNEKKIFS
jgi:hypothetical protein